MSCQQPEKLENTEQHILSPKSNELPAKITIFKRLSYNIDGKIKTVQDKLKLRQFMTSPFCTA